MTTLMRMLDDGEVYLILLPVYVLLLVGERIAHALLSRERWNDRDAASNIAITIAFLGVDVGVGALLPVALLSFIYTHMRLFTLGYGPGGWFAAFVLYDLAWYLNHRMGHRIGFFWAMHHIHHSSEEYNMTVASRGFVADNTLLMHPIFYVLPILGFSPLQFLCVKVVTNVWGIAQHTRLVGRLGFFDRIFATPSSHRVHHGVNAKYIDRNYGEVLMVWDHLFGTYQQEEEPPIYGVIEPIRTYNPVRIQIAGFRWLAAKMRQAHGWRNKLACLYQPPEWQPVQHPRSDI